MDPTVEINERVDVVAVFNRQGDGPSRAKRSGGAPLCRPCKLRWRGREIDITELALRYPTTQGHRMIHVFHVTDGANGYRIEFDAEALTWTLVAMVPELGEFQGGDSGYFHDGDEAPEMYKQYHEPEYERFVD